MRFATALFAAAATLRLGAGSANPLKSPHCTRALSTLQRLESAALATHRNQPNRAADKRSSLQSVHAVKAQQKRSALVCHLDIDAPAMPIPPFSFRTQEPVRVSPLVPPH